MISIVTAIENWKRQGVELHEAIEEPVVTAALDKMGRDYSRDVVALYCATGGMKEGESDSHLWSLWPIERVLSENSRYSRPHILFADFLIDSHLYCFRYNNKQNSSVCVDYLSGEEPEVIAGSVEEFFNVFVSDPAKLRVFE